MNNSNKISKAVTNARRLYKDTLNLRKSIKQQQQQHHNINNDTNTNNNINSCWPPTNRIQARQLLHQILLLDKDKGYRQNQLVKNLLLLDKEFVYLQYEGIPTYIATRFKHLMIPFIPNSVMSRVASDGVGDGNGTSTNGNGASNHSNHGGNDATTAQTEDTHGNDKTIGKIAFMITRQQKQALKQLSYTPPQIKSFKPIEALIIVEQKLIMNASDHDHDDDDHSKIHWRQELDRLLEENDILTEQQQEQQKQQQQHQDFQSTPTAMPRTQESMKKRQHNISSLVPPSDGNGNGNGVGNHDNNDATTAQTEDTHGNDKTIGKIAFMITRQQKQALKQLSYTPPQIKSFKPIEALIIVEQKLIMNASDHDDDDARTHSKIHWRQELDRLLEENDILMEQQQQQQQKQQQQSQHQDFQSTTTAMPRIQESTKKRQNTVSSLVPQSGFEQTPSINHDHEHFHEHDRGTSSSNALAIVIQHHDHHDNGNGYVGNGAHDDSSTTHARTRSRTRNASQPMSSQEAISYVSSSDVNADGDADALTADELSDARESNFNVSRGKENEDGGWYEVVQVVNTSVESDSSASPGTSTNVSTVTSSSRSQTRHEVVALYKTREEAQEFLEFKLDLVKNRLKQKTEGGMGGAADVDANVDDGIEFRIQRRT
eukprot:scaffold179_cov229-Chaetoceros_neogracile.AAC.2